MGIWKLLIGEREVGRARLLPFMQMAGTGAYGDDELEIVQVKYIIVRIHVAFGDDVKAPSLLMAMSLTGRPIFMCQRRCGVVHNRWQSGYSCKVCLMDLCDNCVETLEQGK